jgi:hypothetical protein
LAAKLARLGAAVEKEPAPPKPAEAFALTYCAVCGRPIAPGSQALELRFGRFIDGLAADHAGNRARPAFVHAGMAAGTANCLSEESLSRAVTASGAQLRIAAFHDEPDEPGPGGRLIFLPGATGRTSDDPDPDPGPPSPWSRQRRRTDREGG